MSDLKVYQAINRVQAALAKDGITKARKNQQQGYDFRGIDDVYNALSPLLAEHKLCILPRMLRRECVDRQTAKGGTLIYTVVEAEFDFVSAEDGSRHTVKTFGEAMDSGDKSCNKAMSAAFKYAAMQAFAIPTEGDNDTENHTHELAPRQTDAKVPAKPKKEPKPQTDAKAPLELLRNAITGIKNDPASGFDTNDWDQFAIWLSDGEFQSATQFKTASDDQLLKMLSTLNTAIHDHTVQGKASPVTVARAYTLKGI